MITMVNLADVQAIINAHLDWRVANEDIIKRHILAALDKLTDPKELAARDRVRAHLAPFSVGYDTIVNPEHVAADGTRTPLAAITTPKSTEEVVREAVAEARVDKGADLRAAGWHCSPDAGWTNGLDGEYMSTDDAYAAMLAEREKAPPRDTDQEPVDAEMEAWAKSVLPGQPRWPVRAG